MRRSCAAGKDRFFFAYAKSILPFRRKFVSLFHDAPTDDTPFCRTAVQPHADRKFRDRTIMKTHKPTVFILMSLLSIFGCGRAKTPEYPADRLSARDGTEFTITFFKHASLAISVGGKYIYVDPVSANADYGALPESRRRADHPLALRPPRRGGRREAARRRHPKSFATGPRPKLSK